MSIPPLRIGCPRRGGSWFGSAALLLTACSATAPPTSPVALGQDAGRANGSSNAGAPNTTGADPIARRPLPVAPSATFWADVVRPEPATVDLAKPGGNAPDPHAASLVRLLEEPLGGMRDKDNQIVLNYPDFKHWKRVRYRAFEHLVGFRYGDRFDATVVVLAYDTRSGRVPESRACIRQAETMARPRLRALSVTIGAITETEIEWHGQRILVHAVDGVFPWGFERIEFSAAWAAYPAYDKACLVQGIGIKHEKRADPAHLVRDRWILEVASKIEPLTTTKPYRH